MTSFTYVIDEQSAALRIDKVLTKQNPHQSRSQIQSWITDHFVTVNDRYIKPNYKCQLGDVIKWSIPEDKPFKLIPEEIPLDIVYEDDYLLVVNKPRGMVVYPTEVHQTGTLVNALLFHCSQLSMLNDEERPGIVHRLDKDTSGLLVVAKNDHTHLALTEQLAKQNVKRVYEALVHGSIEHESGMIDAPIGRDPKNRLRMAVVKEGKPAVTHFTVLQNFDHFTHVECQLETGRTHQIRVHMQYIEHPVVGDPKYGEKDIFDVGGQALFAKELHFYHPDQNEEMHFKIEAPSYFKELINKIEKMT